MRSDRKISSERHSSSMTAPEQVLVAETSRSKNHLTMECEKSCDQSHRKIKFTIPSDVLHVINVEDMWLHQVTPVPVLWWLGRALTLPCVCAGTRRRRNPSLQSR